MYHTASVVTIFTERVPLGSISAFDWGGVAAAATLRVHVIGALGSEPAALFAGIPAGREVVGGGVMIGQGRGGGGDCSALTVVVEVGLESQNQVVVRIIDVLLSFALGFVCNGREDVDELLF